MWKTLAVSCLAALPVVAQAPAYQQWVAADADLVAHVDLEAASKATVGRRGLQALGAAKVDAIDGFTGWVEQKELALGSVVKSVTVYCTPDDDAPAVLIVAMASAPDGLFDDLPEPAGYWRKTIDERVVHSFRADDRRIYAHVVAVQRGVQPVVFCHELDDLSKAVDVVEGKRPNLVGTQNPVAQAPAQGVYLHVVAVDTGKLVKRNPASTLLKESDSVVLSVGEHEGRVSAELSVQAKDEETAGDVASMARGLIAMARLIAGREDTAPDVKKGRQLLLDSIDVKARGARLAATFTCDADEFVRLLDL